MMIQDKPTLRASVRSVVEYTLMRGDISPQASANRLLEGIRGHQRAQAGRGKGYRSEVPLRQMVEGEQINLLLTGRMDGLMESPLTVEEIKTTYHVHSVGEDDHPVHWAQAICYAHMLLQTRDDTKVTIRLLYCAVQGDARVSFSRDYSRKTLEEAFFSFVKPFLIWQEALYRWRILRDDALLALPFPFDSYRKGQRDMAAHAYFAMREGKKLFVQAPTGTGKTAAALYPALKALGGGLSQRVFYLTARGTTATVAQDTLVTLRKKGLRLRAITLTAREKICPGEERICDPDHCPRARGHYDRLKEGLWEAMNMEALPREEVIALAQRHDLCPFELGLDLASMCCDLVICDYNYAFDPNVLLKRFFMNKSDAVLLIDEAHHLLERAREMFSSELSGKQIRLLRKEVGKEGRGQALYKALSALLKSLKEIRDALPQELQGEMQCAHPAPPLGLQEPLSLFLECAQPLLGKPLPYAGSLADLYFAAFFFAGTLAGMEKEYLTLYTMSKQNTDLRLYCADPAPYLARAFAKVRAGVLFSATLWPMEMYLRALGGQEGDATLALPSPFPPENLCVLQLGISTRYQAREKTLDALCEALSGLCQGARNYLACFPSYAYMEKAREAFALLRPDVYILTQTRDMDAHAQEEMLANFSPNPTRTMLCFIVMGGVFSEGIDLPGERLSGVAIVGVGLPQIGFERDVLKGFYDARGEDGFALSYRNPGIIKVLQGAGRVIRTSTDRGVVLLVDDRYLWRETSSLLPPHWQVQPLGSAQEVKAACEVFWQKGEELGHLHHS